MGEPRDFAGFVDLPWAELVFPEERLANEGCRRLLEFLGVRIVKTNAEIDRDLDERFGTGKSTLAITHGCGFEFTGPADEALLEQSRHMQNCDWKPEPRPGGKERKMGSRTCEVCKREQAPTHGRYVGIGAACRAKGFRRSGGKIIAAGGNVAGQIATTGGGQTSARPEPPTPEPEAPVPESPEPEENGKVADEFTGRAERLVRAAKKVDELQRARAELDLLLADAMNEYEAAGDALL